MLSVIDAATYCYCMHKTVVSLSDGTWQAICLITFMILVISSCFGERDIAQMHEFKLCHEVEEN